MLYIAESKLNWNGILSRHNFLHLIKKNSRPESDEPILLLLWQLDKLRTDSPIARIDSAREDQALACIKFTYPIYIYFCFL